MQLRFFTIPVHSSDDAAEALNRFLGGHRILAMDRSFVQDGANSAWSLCVSFEPAGDGARPRPGDKRAARTDYREVLNEADFAVFARLRALRKELADAAGVIDAGALQTGFFAARAVTAHADAATWRREQLRRQPLASTLSWL